MRLNRVESFYAFLLRFRSEGSEEKGRPATASPHVAPATHGQAAAKAPCKGATDCGQGQPAREAGAARSGSSPQERPVPLTGAAARKGGSCRHGQGLAAWHPQRGLVAGCPQGAATRGQPCRQQGRQRRPQGWPPLGRVAIGGQGQPPPTQGQQQRQRRHRWGKRG
ncbi:hypothetical protein BHM03_00055690 [Ensete ventricosum]|nr:hypothetical protein BHM03_00055690 [Ensete ventricosum]